MGRKLSRFFWRVGLVWQFGPDTWKHTRYLSNRKPTAQEIEWGLGLESEALECLSRNGPSGKLLRKGDSEDASTCL